MQIRRYLTADEFLAQCGPFLEQDEAGNETILGLVNALPKQTLLAEADALLYAFLEEEVHHGHGHAHSHAGRPLLCAVSTLRRRGWVIAAQPDLKPEQVLVAAISLRSTHPDIGGVMGRRELTRAFANHWTPDAKLHFNQLQYRLDTIIPPRGQVTGTMRPPIPTDIDFLPDWIRSFRWEAAQDEISPELAQKEALDRIASPDLFFWDDDGAVSMAQMIRFTQNGCTVGLVYTPPTHRGKGYATHLVAGLCQRYLDAGYRFSMLFTNEANPTSNKIYQSIGFYYTGEFARYWL